LYDRASLRESIVSIGSDFNTVGHGESNTSVSTELMVSVAKLVIVDGAAVTVLYCVVSWTTVEYCVAVSVAQCVLQTVEVW
jgi:hypothetical protein